MKLEDKLLALTHSVLWPTLAILSYQLYQTIMARL
jgi:hypothetical protein